MNRKGVFLTFMVFLLIGAVLALSLVLRQSNVREERTAIDESASKEINETFNSIYSQILEERTGYAGEVQKRYLVVGAAPSSGGTSFSVTQQVPPKTTVSASDIVDALNLFSVFLSNKDISQDLNITAYVPDAFNAQAWGAGTEDPDVGFLIQPYCIRYLPLQVEDRLMGFEIPADWQDVGGGTIWKQWDCVQPFDIANIEEIDINFFIGKKDVGSCHEYLQSEPNCDPQGSFRTGSTCTTNYSQVPCAIAYCPKVDVNFTETESTAKCYFGNPPNNTPPKCTRGIRGNLDYTMKNNSILLQLAGGASSGITLNLLDSPTGSPPPRVYLLYYDGQDICLDNNVLVDIKFKGPTWVDLAGFEFGIAKPGFDLCRRTKYGICPGKIACAYEAAEVGESYCSDGKDNDCDGATDCADSGCSTATVCTCPNGTCSAGESCPADVVSCTEIVCQTAACTLGCVYSPIAAESQDTTGSLLCNDITGCAPIPCECNGTGTCRSKCGNGKCTAGENCPADAGVCPEPAKCYIRTCISGCNALNGPTTLKIAARQQDTTGTYLCNNSTGCTSPPCECNGSGTCRNRCGNGYCDTGESAYTCPGDCGYY